MPGGTVGVEGQPPFRAVPNLLEDMRGLMNPRPQGPRALQQAQIELAAIDQEAFLSGILTESRSIGPFYPDTPHSGKTRRLHRLMHIGRPEQRHYAGTQGLAQMPARE